MIPLQHRPKPVIQLTLWAAIGLLAILSLLTGILHAANSRDNEDQLYGAGHILQGGNQSLKDGETIQKGIVLAASRLTSQVDAQSASALAHFYAAKYAAEYANSDQLPVLEDSQSWKLTMYYMKAMYHRLMAEIDYRSLLQELHLPLRKFCQLELCQSFLAASIMFLATTVFLTQYLREERSDTII